MRMYFIEAYCGNISKMLPRLYRTLETATRAAERLLYVDGFDRVVIREIASHSIRNADEQLYILKKTVK